MANTIRTIGVLTSGGDAPGMNAAVRAVARTAVVKGIKVLGIRRGYSGLINGDMIELNLRTVSDTINRGGTFLYSARSLEFKEEAGMQKAKQTCMEMGIDGLVVIGGDGSFRGAKDMNDRGIPCIGIPGTIDNDIACTDYSIGYDTAMNTVMELVDKLRDTAQSHDRCTVVEVMGRHAGDIALNTGIASGATCILVPEVPYDFYRDVIDRMQLTQRTGKKHFIIMVAEGVGNTEELGRRIEAETGIVTRSTILGHVQRGGSPTVRDRVLASKMGCHAVELLARGIHNRVVAVREDQIVDFDIVEALAMPKKFDYKLYEIARDISI